MDQFKPQPSTKQFVSESELQEIKRKRQEEWEKIRRDDQPLERPEEEYDPRSLYERLQENKRKKDEEFEESKKLKHLIRGLDNDELSFLELVDKSKLEEESQRIREEKEAINELKSSVYSTHKEQEKLYQSLKESMKRNEKHKTTKRSQAALLASVVKPKSDSSKQDKVETISAKSACILPGIENYDSNSSDSDT